MRQHTLPAHSNRQIDATYYLCCTESCLLNPGNIGSGCKAVTPPMILREQTSVPKRHREVGSQPLSGMRESSEGGSGRDRDPGTRFPLSCCFQCASQALGLHRAGDVRNWAVHRRMDLILSCINMKLLLFSLSSSNYELPMTTPRQCQKN